MNKTNLLKKIDSVTKLLDEIRQEVAGKSAVDQLIARTSQQIAEFVESGLCLKCGKPLADKRPRGVHEHCYQKLRRDGELDRAEANGRILPAGKPGPKSLDALEPIAAIVTQKRVANKKATRRNSNED